ncbi:MAG: type 4a pilus biogenesis protein PilO [Candidatus Daviesbacteria bacterium]|nr:type 4a pilus biogenesis protein PilO [Candidatus Daviesbacteria bacterium]
MTIILFILFALRPTISTIVNLQENLDKSQQTLETLEQKGRNLEAGRQNLNNLESTKRLKIKTSIPDQVNIGTLVASLQTSVEKGASVSAVQVQPLSVYKVNNQSLTNSLGEINFSFNVSGNYSEILQTVDKLSHSPRLVKITTLSINRLPEGRNLLSVTGKAYFLK